MEQKKEINAEGRAAQGKIMRLEKYKGSDPGKLEIRVVYDGGYLVVSLRKAWLAGKRSQDPYALVYLLAPGGQCWFQIGNNRTRTHDRTLEPAFNSDFQFMIDYQQIVSMNLSLVVAIWDEDSKSRDDYMAGIRAVLPRSPISNIGQWNIVKLQHQEADGHPASVPFSLVASSSHQANIEAGQPSSQPTASPTGSPYPGSSAYPPPSAPASAPPSYPPPMAPGSTSSPYPPGQSSPYPSGQSANQSPYPGGSKSPYPGAPSGQSPYPNAGAPPQLGGSPYPSAASPYPGPGAPSPYPKHISPYPGTTSTNK